MQNQNTIRAINSSIGSFIANCNKLGDKSSPASLAKTRLASKFEEPRSDTANKRRTDAWQRWITSDANLLQRELLGPNWAKARLIVHECLRDFRLGTLVFTNGSNFEPVGPRTSIACKLEDTWTITLDCFDMFAVLAYRNHALHHAVKKRFTRYCRDKHYSEKRLNRILWDRYKNKNNAPFEVFKFKLFTSVTFVMGNRWSTVPKNNEKDRSICLEPFCNMLVQRSVGLGLRRSINNYFGIDLDTLADEHRARISDSNVATIDLSDCSDTISMWLTNYLLPRRVRECVSACRSDMTFGPDDHYHVVNKVSSMGNGFTFDLMTLFLTALTRSLDPTSTVFGDDIICQNRVADEVVLSLQVCGFRVNESKTLIRSAYRESCGAHYMDNYGYVTSFDQHWIVTDQDLIVALNKCAILASVYADDFEILRKKIWSCVPLILLGATTARQVVDVSRPPSYELDTYVRYGPVIHVDPPHKLLKSLRRSLRYLCKPGRISVARAYESRNNLGRYQLSSSSWEVYFQYLYSGRVTSKVPRSVVKSALVARVDEEQLGLVNALRPARD